MAVDVVTDSSMRRANRRDLAKLEQLLEAKV